MHPLIRLAASGDAPAIRNIYGPIIQNTTTSFELEVPSIQEMEQRIVGTLEKFPWLVMVDQDQIMGYAYAGTHRGRPAYRWSVELSVYVNPNYYRQQVGAKLYGCLMELLRIQGYRNFLAGITMPNDPSVSFHSALGFKHIGTYHKVGFKFGAWHDVSWWELQIEGADPPSETLSISQASVLTSWDQAFQMGNP